MRGLEGVTDRVAEVQDRSAAALRRVRRHDLGLHLAGLPQDLEPEGIARILQSFQPPLQRVEEGLRADDPALDHFGQAGPPMPGRQARQRVEDTVDADRLMEAPHEVLDPVEVDGGLASDRTVGHGEGRGCDRAPVDTPHPGRREVSGDVADGPPAHGDDERPPFELALQGGAMQAQHGRRRLAALAATQANDPSALGRSETPQGRTMAVEHAGVSNDHPGPVPLVLSQRGPCRREIRPQADRIRRIERNVEITHERGTKVSATARASRMYWCLGWFGK